MNTINITKFSDAITARNSCRASNNTEWEQRWNQSINEACDMLPHGSGIDSGMKLDESKHIPRERLVFTFSFHHMDENGYYCGWTDHTLIITPRFGGYNMRITGKNYRSVKDYLYDLFYNIFIV